jgi:hypothetical protein
MLSPDQRTLLTEALRPPAGAVLDRAVATTFTLDLAAALAAPLAFAAWEVSEVPDPISLMEAVRATAERVDIFCQTGLIAVPRQSAGLMAFLEPMVHPVTAPRPGFLFHPKLWLLKYTAGAEASYRLICLSRNLTHDRSWDLALRLDGKQATGRPALSAARTQNAPLTGLLRALPDRATRPLSAAKRTRIEAFASDVATVRWALPPNVTDCAFHVLGLPSVRATHDLSGGYRRLIIAPFCNDAGLDELAAPAERGVMLVSRDEALDALQPTTLARISTYILDESATLAAEPGGDREVLTDLHAKVFVIERNRRGHVFVGSPNATDAAFHGNVEVLVELIGGASKLGVDAVLGPDGASTALSSLLSPYPTEGGATTDPDDDAQRTLEAALRTVAALPWSAAVHQVGGLWTERATAGKPLTLTDISIRVALLTAIARPAEWTHKLPACEFTGLALIEVTPFLVITVTDQQNRSCSSVVVAQLTGAPDRRLDEIIAEQVNTPEKFLKFLMLVLGFQAAPDSESREGRGDGRWTFGNSGSSGVLETLVQSLVDQPRALADVARLVDRLNDTEAGRKVLPEGFTDVWKAIAAARKKMASIRV